MLERLVLRDDALRLALRDVALRPVLRDVDLLRVLRWVVFFRDFFFVAFFFVFLAVFAALRNDSSVGAPACPFLRTGRPPRLARS